MPEFDAVIFDMDGTLIESLLDFKAIRAQLGIVGQDGIIEAVAAMPDKERARAEQWLVDLEVACAHEAVLIPGACEVVCKVRAAGFKTALLTRNAEEAMRIILNKFDCLKFDLTWSRENGPIKPEPDGILRACNQLDVEPSRTICIGDFRYDIEAANAAGAKSVLLAISGRPNFADQADYVISKLSELLEILEIF